MEKQRFLQRKDVWCNDPDCFVDVKETDLYKRFKSACLSPRDEVTEHIHQKLTEIEAAQIDTRLGEYGRTYQFVDSSFPPNEYSIGDCEATGFILGWRCAPGISDIVELFDGGTHPDEVEVIYFLLKLKSCI
jgi:hypothetical protein